MSAGRRADSAERLCSYGAARRGACRDAVTSRPTAARERAQVRLSLGRVSGDRRLEVTGAVSSGDRRLQKVTGAVSSGANWPKGLLMSG